MNRCLSIKGAEDQINKPYAFEISTTDSSMYFVADKDKVCVSAQQAARMAACSSSCCSGHSCTDTAHAQSGRTRRIGSTQLAEQLYGIPKGKYAVCHSKQLFSCLMMCFISCLVVTLRVVFHAVCLKMTRATTQMQCDKHEQARDPEYFQAPCQHACQLLYPSPSASMRIACVVVYNTNKGQRYTLVLLGCSLDVPRLRGVAWQLQTEGYHSMSWQVLLITLLCDICTIASLAGVVVVHRMRSRSIRY